ncbi:hypothetical protein, partial [Tolypothrix sp. PCC 7601]|uniref:hypothetical protein n=1 Tax=Tolypothrix sp. PCC 7601 TaxID=1188 RepID=UPI0005EAB326
AGEGELNLWLPSPCGRGAQGEGETFQPRGFHVKLTRLGTALPLKLSVLLVFELECAIASRRLVWFRLGDSAITLYSA